MNPHLEGAAVLGFSLFAYHWNHGSWLLFALLFLLPDVSMVGYLANARAGAAIYNAIHTCVGPLLLAGYSVGTAHHTTLLLVSDLGGAYRLRPTAWVRPEVSDTFHIWTQSITSSDDKHFTFRGCCCCSRGRVLLLPISLLWKSLAC